MSAAVNSKLRIIGGGARIGKHRLVSVKSIHLYNKTRLKVFANIRALFLGYRLGRRVIGGTSGQHYCVFEETIK